jgi:hypothetical protein
MTCVFLLDKRHLETPANKMWTPLKDFGHFPLSHVQRLWNTRCSGRFAEPSSGATCHGCRHVFVTQGRCTVSHLSSRPAQVTTSKHQHNVLVQVHESARRIMCHFTLNIFYVGVTWAHSEQNARRRSERRVCRRHMPVPCLPFQQRGGPATSLQLLRCCLDLTPVGKASYPRVASSMIRAKVSGTGCGTFFRPSTSYLDACSDSVLDVDP